MTKKIEKLLQAIKSVEWDLSVQCLAAPATALLLTYFEKYIKPGRTYPQVITFGDMKMVVVGTKECFWIYPHLGVTPEISAKKLSGFAKKHNLVINCTSTLIKAIRSKAEYKESKDELSIILKEFINEDELIRMNIPKLALKGDKSVSIDKLINEMEKKFYSMEEWE